MNTYTHYRLAAMLEPLFAPQQLADYYWGAVAPDVRYLAGQPRAQTHRSRTELLALHARYPQCASFIQGYQVHCLLDEIDLTKVILGAFPLNLLGGLLRGKFNQHHAAVLVELHYLQGPHLPRPFGGDHNPVLEGMNITAEDSRAFSEGIREYLVTPTIACALATFQRLGFTRTGQGEKYTRAARSLENKRLLRSLLLWGVRNARLERHVESHVRAALAEFSNKGFVVS
jgi:hypothetical protein